MLSIHPVRHIPEIEKGRDLAAVLALGLEIGGLLPLQTGDVLVVTSKILSKAEGRLVELNRVSVSEEARTVAEQTRKDPRLVQLVLNEAAHVVRKAANVLIVRHRSGHVMANAGIDQSNLGSASGEHVLLLPEDADAAARNLHQALAERLHAPLAIVISDSFGRPWRYGVVNVAIGAAGLPALVDKRGERDRDGRTLEVTQVALADMIASAAGLVTGEGAEGIPAALVRGLVWQAPDLPAAAIVRPLAEDLFR